MANDTITPPSSTAGVMYDGKGERPGDGVPAVEPKTAAPVTKAPGSILDAPPDAASDKSILGDALDEAGQAENKRLLEADVKTLSPEELGRRKELEDANKAEAAKTVPEKYDVKLPEGMAQDTGLIEKMTPVFKEMGITAAQAQKLTDVYAPYVQAKFAEQQKAFTEAQENNFKNFLETERKNTMDKLGANAKQELVFAAKSRDRFLSKDTQEMLNAAGIANNFSFISDLIRIGKAISEDKLVPGRGVRPGSNKSDGEVLYGKPE